MPISQNHNSRRLFKDYTFCFVLNLYTQADSRLHNASFIFILAGEGGGVADVENIENAICHLILEQWGGICVIVISYINKVCFNDDFNGVVVYVCVCVGPRVAVGLCKGVLVCQFMLLWCVHLWGFAYVRVRIDELRMPGSEVVWEFYLIFCISSKNNNAIKKNM